jgi:hypothetical protein
MTSLSDGQFREHLGEFHRQLGLEFGPNYVRLGGGAMLPTAHQSVDVTGTPAGIERILYASVPTESGNIHGLSAHLYAGRSSTQSGISFNFGHPAGEESTWWTPHHANYPGLDPSSEHLDPHRFQSRVREIMETAPPPSEEKRKENALYMKSWQAKTGGAITVRHEAEWNKTPNRYYHFHVGTGKLKPI